MIHQSYDFETDNFESEIGEYERALSEKTRWERKERGGEEERGTLEETRECEEEGRERSAIVVLSVGARLRRISTGKGGR